MTACARSGAARARAGAALSPKKLNIVTFKVDDAEKSVLCELAFSQGVSVSELLRDLIQSAAVRSS